MADSTIGGISGTDNPYTTGSYTPAANEKNTLSITGYFQLLAAQLQNQDMTNPMDNSEMMAQMTQMAMVQAMDAMTTSVQNSNSISISTYAASLRGQEITVAVTEENELGLEEPVGVKYGKVESVNLAGVSPTIKLEGDDTEYPITYVLGLGRIPDPYAEEGDGEEGEGTDETAPPETTTTMEFLDILKRQGDSRRVI